MKLVNSHRHGKRDTLTLTIGIWLTLCALCAKAEVPDVTDKSINQTTTQAADKPDDKPDDKTAEARDDLESPPRRPGSFDIDEEAATRALERSLIQINALLLPTGKMELSTIFGFSSDATDIPVIVPVTDPNDASQVINTLGVTQIENRNYDAIVSASIGLPYDAQFSLNIPFAVKNLFTSTALQLGTIGEENSSIDGLGDISLSFLKTIAKEKGRRPDIITRFSVDFDTGETNNSGLSTGSDAIEYTIGLSATKRQDPLVFSYQLSHTFSERNNGFKAGDVTQLTLGAILAASPYTSIRFSFSQSVVGKANIDGSDIDRANRAPASLSIGTSSVIGRSVFLFSDVSAGLNDTATDYRISIGLSHQFSVF